jgi:hypothetical protein
MERYDRTKATAAAKAPPSKTEDGAPGKSNSKTNSTGVRPGILARFFAGLEAWAADRQALRFYLGPT